MSRSGKGKSKRIMKELHALASAGNLTLSETDSWNESAIGFDSNSRKIVYIDESGNEKIATSFSLEEVKSFKTVPDLTGRKNKGTGYAKENRLGFTFSFASPSRPDLNMNFYVAGFGRMTDNEKFLFEKWAEIIRKNYKAGL
jgi:hypothetical protein